MVSAGAGPGLHARRAAGDVDSDAPAPLAGPGARRIAYRETKHRPRRIVEEARQRARADDRGSAQRPACSSPASTSNLRIGYRVPEDAPEELRALLARMLDGVEVRRRDA